MSAGLPYPVSNNRASFSAHPSSPPYPPPSSSNHPYSYTPYPARAPAAYDANHVRIDSSSSLSGMFHHEEQDHLDHSYSRPAHAVDPYSHHQPQPREHIWPYPQPLPDAAPPRARLDHPAHDIGLAREYQSPVSHAQSVPAPSHGHAMVDSLPATARSPPSGASTGRSRREKPRLELAPDQPLTTQGKPRTRVYVACVQCRNRKIRCDGAKPTCHNCNRRPETPVVCTYDATPKRRGPDRIPGARQRSAGGSGERPPRRRRRAPPDGAGQAFSSPQSPAQSAVDVKSVPPYSPTAQSYMTNMTSVPHPENLTIIQEVGPGQYSRHRQSLPGPGRPSAAGPVGAHYAHLHDLSSHTPAAAYEAIPLGSSLSDVSVPVGYAVGPSTAQTLPLVHRGEPENEYGYDESGQEGEPYKGVGVAMAADPSVQLARETWWDALLVLYARDARAEGSGSDPSDTMALAIPPGVREHTTQNITADLRAIFRASPHWLNFINLPRFFGSLLDPHARHSIQPSLILGALALATFFRSREGDLGAKGRERALKLRDQAQSALEASLSSRWMDHSLAQAAWLLAFFEICAHPLHSSDRVRSSMGLLDSLLRTMKLLSLDEADARASVFSSGVPVVPANFSPISPASSVENLASGQQGGVLSPLDSRPPNQWRPSDSGLPSVPSTTTNIDNSSPPHHHMHPHPQPPTQADFHRPHPHPHPQGRPAAAAAAPDPACNCMIFTLGHSWPLVREFAPLWDMTPTWQSEWQDSEIRKEECRRLVWSSVMLSAGYSSYTAASERIETQQLFLMDPRNYALLFPGESLTRVESSPGEPPPAKESVWALYMRAMLLWNSCIRMRADGSLLDAEKAQFALGAWTEIDAIERLLGRHSCAVERAFLFQGRELLFNSRMCIAYEFQRCLPQPTAHAKLLFYRHMAEEWLAHQASLADRVLSAGLHSVTGLPASDLAKRPFLLFWFMSQIERALSLWSYDRSLARALEVAQALSRPVEYLMALWPCPEQRRRWEDLREKLKSSCLAAAVVVPAGTGTGQGQEAPRAQL